MTHAAFSPTRPFALSMVAFAAILMSLCLSPTQSEAQVTFNGGPKYWYATWENSSFQIQTAQQIVPLNINGITFDRTIPAATVLTDDSSSRGTGLYGGSLNLTVGRFVISATALTGQYDLEVRGRYVATPLEDVDATATTSFNAEAEADRLDVDFGVSFIPIRDYPNLALTAGYKLIQYSYDEQTINSQLTYRSPVGDVTLPSQQLLLEEFDTTFSGPAIGFTGFETMGRIWYSFGSVSYIPFLTTDTETEDITNDDSGWAINGEVGVGVQLLGGALRPSLSYRYQRFDGFGDLDDTFHGATFSIVGVIQ